MFFTYLGRELRRRARQAIFIALGLAVGIGLVITVTAASTGVKNSQATVLHSLYGVGTDLTVTQPPAAGESQATKFGFRQKIQAFRQGQIAAGTKININNLINAQFGTLDSSSVSKVTQLGHVAAAVGGLTLNDITVTGTVPSVKAGSTSLKSNFTTNSFTVSGVDVSKMSIGALSSAKVTSGRNLTSADAKSDKAVVNANYAKQNKLKVNDKIKVGGTSFTIAGIVNVPQAGSPPDVYVPLAKAQGIGKTGTTALSGKINTIYVSAASAGDIPAVQSAIAKALPKSTITDQDNLASQVSGSLSSASSLANNLGKWLSIAVLIAAFLLASLLTMAAVSRRVREFGTLKALGWRSSRIIAQVLGESVAVGILGGVAGVGLGYAGATLIDKLAPPLTATVGSAPAAGSGGGPIASTLQSLSSTAHTVKVTLTAPVTLDVIVLAVVLALAGGLIAGGFGGWRAARLRPAAALAKVE